MRRILMGAMLTAVCLWVAGCGGGDGKSSNEKEFQKLYKSYSTRFHEKMVTEAERLQPVEVYAEAARMWDETYALHKDILAGRVKEILGDLDAAPPIQEDMYLEVASLTRPEPKEQPKGIVLKQILWNPLGAAQMGLSALLGRILNPQSNQIRQLLMSNAGLIWEAADRNPEKPKLLLRQGPMLYSVDLSRKDDYYQVDKIRWLRPKSMGPIAPTPAPGTEGAPAGAPAAGAPAAPGTPAAAPAAAPVAPATPPAAPAAAPKG